MEKELNAFKDAIEKLLPAFDSKIKESLDKLTKNMNPEEVKKFEQLMKEANVEQKIKEHTDQINSIKWPSK